MSHATKAKKQPSFPSIDDPSIGDPYTSHEILMQALSYTLRSKPDWVRKSQDSTIKEKWRSEALAQSHKTTWGAPMSSKMINYVLEELALHAERAEQGIEAGCFDGIWQSDTLIADDLRQALINRVDTELENVPAEQRDYHPGSSKQVIDLVHPSLYPLQYGHTLVEQPDPDTKDGTSKLVVAEAPKNSWSSFESSKHAWLPAEFSINDQGKASIDSYINNLQPTLKASLYPVLASVFTRFVPLFERVLDNLLSPPPRRIPVKGDVLARAVDWDDFDVPRYKVPEPGKFSLRNARKADEVIYTLKGRTVQVIVKLANIEPTPENPEYGGGTWHCEGMINEKIVASGLYYYEQNNIEESRLAFRGAINEGKLWDSKGDEQMLKSSVGVVYGVDEALNQNFNAVITSSGRAVAFPNIYQHQVKPFSLADKTKPGHRKILAFFLVDPDKRIPSTANVAPQQREWIEHELSKPRIASPENATFALPVEVWAQIVDMADLMTFEDAKKVRLGLMEERKSAVRRDAEYTFEREFSMCEH